ncbi:asparagine synthase [Clostridium carnis]|uniref:asparagine synthase (glutamine-hydrolyzing) n=1 Tax=Clostridium carnis TaxID=1530 RepID=A0ABY6SVD3_9CLOT|nr:asparagine synthase (glutamine-hydrolyzing) [Clostridium carnis]VDG72435.1 asparagine synthase [Clostridium carnis]
MCGISGFVNKKLKDMSLDKILKDMTKSIEHRGPDGEGYYIEKKFGLGHRRLSIIDLNKNANQPFISERYSLVFNGEIYNYKDLKKELKEYKYLTNSDTEVILAAYDKWGKDCVKYFRGMWAFILYDKNDKIFFCSRDRFGIKPFYYYDNEEYIAFASEIKQFIKLPNWRAIGNKARIHDYFIFSALDHTDETLFKNVRQLLPGHNLIYNLKLNKFTIEEYYNIRNNLNRDVSNNNFKDLIKQSIEEHMISDVSLGACLSGGLDSSTIVVLMNKILEERNDYRKIETVSSCFEDRRYDEQEYIDEVNKAIDAKSYKVFPRYEELFENLDDIIYFQDEPFATTSIFAQWNVFREAATNNIKVMLDGQGADEQLAGYFSFYIAYFNELFLKMEFSKLDNEINKFMNNYDFLSKKQIFDRGFRMQLGSLKDIIKEKMSREGRFSKPIFDLYYEYYEKFNSSIRSIKDFSIYQINNCNLLQLLHYEDRNSMMFSVESRVPFLDHRLVEFVLLSESEEKIKNGMTKVMLRDGMKGILPEKIRNRKDKMGFMTPESIWIRKNRKILKMYFEEGCIFLDEMIDKKVALEWFDEQMKNDKNIDSTIWRIICLSRWIKIFNVEEMI